MYNIKISTQGPLPFVQYVYGHEKAGKHDFFSILSTSGNTNQMPYLLPSCVHLAWEFPVSP